MASLAGVEPATLRLGGECSIQLSYRDSSVEFKLFINSLQCLVNSKTQIYKTVTIAHV